MADRLKPAPPVRRSPLQVPERQFDRDPYYTVPLELSSVVEIVVGPCAHPDLARDAVLGLVNKFELKEVRGRVKTSEIPYRNY